MSNSKTPLPLETRHVFLDTQVYRKLHHNVSNPALATLARHIIDRTIVLHITDLTLLEVRRQIAEDVSSKARDLTNIEKSLRRWRHHSENLPSQVSIDPVRTAEDIFRHFSRTVCQDWSATVHRAQLLSATEIFDDYFSRRPPFDTESSKEFPDAFVLKALDHWCSNKGAIIIVVTQDAAMSRAALKSEALRHISTLDEVLTRASAKPDVDTERLAEAVVSAPGFDRSLELLVEDFGQELTFDYRGELPDGEVVGQSVQSIEGVTDYSVAWVGATSVCMFLMVDTNVLVEVSYEDRSLAIYDNEDGRWFGGETAYAELPTVVPIQIFVEVDLQNYRMFSPQLLRTDYDIAESEDWLGDNVGLVR